MKNFFCFRSAKNFIPENWFVGCVSVGPGRGVVVDGIWEKEGRRTRGNGLGKMNLTKAQPRSSEDHGPFWRATETAGMSLSSKRLSFSQEV